VIRLIFLHNFLVYVLTDYLLFVIHHVSEVKSIVTAGAATYSEQETISYTNGRICTFKCHVIFTGHTGSGSLRVTLGTEINAKNGAFHNITAWILGIGYVKAIIDGGTKNVVFYDINNNQLNISASMNISIYGWYMIDYTSL
jgi:hypothetical protein